MNRGMVVLQTTALPLGYGTEVSELVSTPADLLRQGGAGSVFTGMHRLLAPVVFSILVAAPSVADTGKGLVLDTRFVNLAPAMTEPQCLQRAKTLFTSLLKSDRAFHTGDHAIIAQTSTAILQVECLQGQGVKGAYVIAAASGNADSAQLAQATAQVQKGLKEP